MVKVLLDWVRWVAWTISTHTVFCIKQSTQDKPPANGRVHGWAYGHKNMYLSSEMKADVAI